MKPTQWNDIEDAENAFPSDWIEQCEIAEAGAAEDMPRWTHEGLMDKAGFSLWIGVFERERIPKDYTINLTHKRKMVCTVSWTNGGAIVTDANGTEVTGLDVVAYVSCAEVRRILGKPRGR